MRRFAILLVLAAMPANGARRPAAQLRCGWLDNVTPGNYALIDRDGEWTIAEQGGYEAPGFARMPDMSAGDWVETNGPHGHGCGCMTVVVDRKSRRVTRLLSARPVSIKRCLRDPALPKM